MTDNINLENIKSLLEEFKKNKRLIKITYSVVPWTECEYVPSFIDYIARKLNIINEEVYMPKYTLRTQLKDFEIRLNEKILINIEEAEMAFYQ
jgi:hypothetical protein